MRQNDTMNDQEQTSDKDRKISESLRRFIEEQTENNQFSGAVLLARNAKPILEMATGMANENTETPNTVETSFNLGSCNKMFTGIAIAQLVERGMLKFDGKVGEYLPDFPNADITANVTIHHLLTHTSGMGHFLKDKARFKQVRENLKSIQSFVDLFKDEPLEFRPGEKYSYSANGYELLGAIIEKISGLTYYDYIRENIFKSAGMNNTGFEADGNSAAGYTTKDDEGNQTLSTRRSNVDLNFVMGGAGGAGYSTCGNLLSFSQALWGNKLLSPETTRVITTPKIEVGTKNGETLHYGYGFQILQTHNTWRVGHGGEFFGVSARFDTYPEQGYTVVSLSNHDAPAAHRIAEKAKELILT